MDAGLAAHGHGWPIAAGPRSRTGVRVCRAQARHRTKGARAFGYFALFKVTRCKSETDSSHHRRNGYVHQQESHRRQAAIAGRPAPAAMDMYTCKKWVSCQAAIASRLTPTRGSGTDPRAWEPREPTRHDKTGNGLDMKSLIRDRNQRSAGSLSCTPLHAIDSCAASIGKGGSSARNAHPSTNAHAA